MEGKQAKAFKKSPSSLGEGGASVRAGFPSPRPMGEGGASAPGGGSPAALRRNPQKKGKSSAPTKPGAGAVARQKNPSAAKQRPQKPVSARDAALDVLTACRRHNAWADAALNAQLRRVPMPPMEAALCSRLVYGVTQHQITLDFYLDAFCTQKVSHLQHPLADVLRLGAYQILFLDRVPDHAAVNEAVRQAMQAGRKSASGMVNAVLRRLSREKNKLPAIPDADPLQALSVRHSHPRWIVERVCGLLGAEEAERFLAENNRIPPLTLQTNPERVTAEALIQELSTYGVEAARRSALPDCIEVSGSGAVMGLPPFWTGKFYVQDAAARLVTEIAGLRSGQSVLDVCAAPGGKSFGAAFAVGDGGSVTACDVSADRLKRVEDGAKRLGLADRIKTAVADGREFHAEWASKFDVVLVDAPCSGLGVIRKKPDIRYRDPAPLDALPELQYAILSNAAQYVRPGGTLIYSTCTVLPEENEAVAERFLSAHTDFHKTPFAAPIVGETSGEVTLWPQRHGTDGFYICRMERNPQ